jgi:hypothetical protein
MLIAAGVHNGRNHQAGKAGEMMGWIECDHDCFNCKLSDCVNNGPARPNETAILRGVHGGWEKEGQIKVMNYMLSTGCKWEEIAAALHMTKSEYNSLFRSAQWKQKQEEKQRRKKNREGRRCSMQRCVANILAMAALYSQPLPKDFGYLPGSKSLPRPVYGNRASKRRFSSRSRTRK